MQELRYWIHFAEAAYYDMDTEDKISRWLAAEGCELLYASKRNAPHAPVYFVAVHQDRKELIVSLRGTVSVDDAVTDMIGAVRVPPSPVICTPCTRMPVPNGACLCGERLYTFPVNAPRATLVTAVLFAHITAKDYLHTCWELAP